MAQLISTRAADDDAPAPPPLHGDPVVDFPLIRIAPPTDVDAARSAIARLTAFDWAIPISPSAVRATFNLLQGDWPRPCGIALLGQGSRRALDAALQMRAQDVAGLKLVQAPLQQQDSEGLWPLLRAQRPQGWRGARVALLRGASGREWLAEQLEAAGALVERIAVYSRVPPAPDAVTLERLRALLQQPCRWQLGAVEAVDNLACLLAAAGMDAAAALASQTALVRHPRVAAAAARIGFGQVETAH